MKTTFSVILAMGIVCTLVTGCGSNPILTLSLQPANAELNGNASTGFYEYIELKAVLSNGQPPIAPQWTSSNACIAVNQGIVQCNRTCSGNYSSTITVAAQGVTASSQISCSVH
jgi:hypothetical protein